MYKLIASDGIAARCFGPAVVSGGSNLDGHWAYWVGPGLACIVHALIYCVAPPHHEEAYNEECVQMYLKSEDVHEVMDKLEDLAKKKVGFAHEISKLTYDQIEDSKEESLPK